MPRLVGSYAWFEWRAPQQTLRRSFRKADEVWRAALGIWDARGDLRPRAKAASWPAAQWTKGSLIDADADVLTTHLDPQSKLQMSEWIVHADMLFYIQTTLPMN